jgi:hypothetical protein
MAVDDMASTIPTARAVCQGRPSSIETPAMASEVPITWAPPKPKIALRMSHRVEGWTSRPIRNSRMTTPNSAKVRTSVCSPTSDRANGPITTPAIR